jgi:hypothetical protein
MQNTIEMKHLTSKEKILDLHTGKKNCGNTFIVLLDE